MSGADLLPESQVRSLSPRFLQLERAQPGPGACPVELELIGVHALTLCPVLTARCRLALHLLSTRE